MSESISTVVARLREDLQVPEGHISAPLNLAGMRSAGWYVGGIAEEMAAQPLGTRTFDQAKSIARAVRQQTGYDPGLSERLREPDWLDQQQVGRQRTIRVFAMLCSRAEKYRDLSLDSAGLSIRGLLKYVEAEHLVTASMMNRIPSDLFAKTNSYIYYSAAEIADLFGRGIAKNITPSKLVRALNASSRYKRHTDAVVQEVAMYKGRDAKQAATAAIRRSRPSPEDSPAQCYSIGELLAQGRLAQGKTQREIAQCSGLPVTVVDYLEKGLPGATVNDLTKYCQSLGLRLTVVPEDAPSM